MELLISERLAQNLTKEVVEKAYSSTEAQRAIQLLEEAKVGELEHISVDEYNCVVGLLIYRLIQGNAQRASAIIGITLEVFGKVAPWKTEWMTELD